MNKLLISSVFHLKLYVYLARIIELRVILYLVLAKGGSELEATISQSARKSQVCNYLTPQIHMNSIVNLVFFCFLINRSLNQISEPSTKVSMICRN